MRIVVANANRRRIAGTEQYLDHVLPALDRAGHSLAFVSEFDRPPEREQIALPAGAPCWCAASSGPKQVLDELRAWRPDLVYVHGLIDVALESRLIDLAPSVLFAHNYRGTCISGTKTMSFPTPRACVRSFGWPCLALYYPRRCGGLRPLTMWRDYQLSAMRLQLMRGYRAIVVSSEHMRAELLRHGVSSETICKLTFPIDAGGPCAAEVRPVERDAVRLLFAGRLEVLKGGQLLLDALPLVARRLRRPIAVSFAGVGPALNDWKRRAARVRSLDPRITVDFSGWLDQPELERVAADADLLVVPSLWPEPFGMVGPEAGLRRLPAAAFAVGGIPEWLTDGVNGCLAPADPPTASGLADAIARCLDDPAVYARLREGAYRVARRFSVADHVAQLVELFSKVVGSQRDESAREHLVG